MPALPKIKKIFGVILLVVGLVCLLFIPLSARVSKIVDFHLYLLSVQEKDEEPIKIDESFTSQEIENEDIPNRVLLPTRDIDLPVKQAKIVKGKWEVFDDKAGFGLGSSVPRFGGNTVIFAHARIGQFLNLKQVKIGDEILIFTENNWFSYKVVQTKEVSPKEVSVISQTDSPTLTLFTCSGFADTKRLIVVATKIS